MKLSRRIYTCLICISAITGCQTQVSQETITQNIMEEKIEESLSIAELYQDLYINAEKTISQEAVDKIEKRLSEQGYSVVNSDRIYPAYLENPDRIYRFWEAVSENKNAEQEILTVSKTGELHYSYLCYEEGEKYQIEVMVGWNEENEPYVISDNCMEILDWTLTENQDFYYQLYPLNMHWDAYTLLRLKPVDKTLYDLTEKYIAPIGYYSNNMFLCDWNSKNYKELCFNDLLDFFYKTIHKEYFSGQSYEKGDKPYYCTYVPEALLEKTIMPYFDISLEEFRELSFYDAEKKAYPWKEISCDNVIYFPTVEPEIVTYHENNDGTLVLTVNARCNDYKTDCLFTHEVTIRPLKNGKYQYLSNNIINRSNYELPPNHPRLAIQ